MVEARASATLPKSLEDVPFDKLGEAGPLKLLRIASVILGAEGKGAVEGLEERRRVDVTSADILESETVADELIG